MLPRVTHHVAMSPYLSVSKDAQFTDVLWMAVDRPFVYLRTFAAGQSRLKGLISRGRALMDLIQVINIACVEG